MAAEFESIPDFAVAANSLTEGAARPRFSICTLVTRPSEYAAMVDSFVSHGFTPADCEYLYLDNSQPGHPPPTHAEPGSPESNRFDAFDGYNIFLSEARGDFIVLCHQDVLLLEEGRAELEQRLDDLTTYDPEWALCGNAGGVGFTRLAIRISDKHGENRCAGPFPVRVTGLDENFIVVRREVNLAVSHNLSGFNLYGSELCIVAEFLGRSAWVIDFHLRHNGKFDMSSGKTAETLYKQRKEIARKYQRVLRSRWVVSTVTCFFLSGSSNLSRLFNSRASHHLSRLIWGTRLAQAQRKTAASSP